MLRAPKATANLPRESSLHGLARWLPDDRPTMALGCPTHETRATSFYPDNSERIRARVILPWISARIIEISTWSGKEEEKRKRGRERERERSKD